jgi:hypothetical protein
MTRIPLFALALFGLLALASAQTPPAAATPVPTAVDTMKEVPLEEASPAPTTPKGEHELGTEEIKAAERLKIDDLKPQFFPMIDPYAPINSVVKTDKYIYDDKILTAIDSIAVPSHYLHSSYLRSPVVDRLITGDVLVFLPRFDKSVSSWELVVSNSNGETVRRVKRNGTPPNIINWDGRDDNNAVINTGETYDFTFYAYDAIGNQTRIPGRPQKIRGLLYHEGAEWVVAMAGDEIFDSRTTRLTAGAQRWFEEAANVVREKFKREVVVFVYSEREDLSAEQGQVVVGELTGRIKLPKDAMKMVPRFVPGLQPKFAKVEVHIR